MTTTPVREKEFPGEKKAHLPGVFIMRRVHSLLGLWLVIYLFEHLLVNSQLAFYLQDDGYGFVKIVNIIHGLPYLKLIEILFLAIPFLIHGAWGLIYLKTSKSNSHKTLGKTPDLSQYKRNRAYTWQRWSSWILVVGILAHVIHMRFVDAPFLIHQGIVRNYVVRLALDPGLYGVADKLHVSLYDKQEINAIEEEIIEEHKELAQFDPTDPKQEEAYYTQKERAEEDAEWIETLKQRPLREGEVIGIAPNAGTAFLLIVREAFKNPLTVILYSILVLAATYHAFNGLWTFLISWGVTLTRRSQRIFRFLCQGLMILVTLMGLGAAWGTYIIVHIQGS